MRFSLLAARLDDVRRQAAAVVQSHLFPFIKGAASDLCVLAGVAAIAYGLGLLWRPIAFIFVGIVCIIVGLRGIQPPKRESA